MHFLGQLWTFGCGEGGRLGQSTYCTIKKVPEIVPNLTNVGQVACGFNHTLAVSSDGLTCWYVLHTVWKFHEFPALRFLREINFRGPKTAILTHYKGTDFFCEFLHFL